MVAVLIFLRLSSQISLVPAPTPLTPSTIRSPAAREQLQPVSTYFIKN